MKVKTRIRNPFAIVHDVQVLATRHPEHRQLCDDIITALLVLVDKRAAAMADLRDVMWDEGE